MNHIRIEIGFGCGFDHEGLAISRDELHASLKEIKKEAARIFGAYTVMPTEGGWTNSSGKLVEEPGFTLFTIQSAHEARRHEIEELVKIIKATLRQEAVAVSTCAVNFELL